MSTTKPEVESIEARLQRLIDERQALMTEQDQLGEQLPIVEEKIKDAARRGVDTKPLREERREVQHKIGDLSELIIDKQDGIRAAELDLQVERRQQRIRQAQAHVATAVDIAPQLEKVAKPFFERLAVFIPQLNGANAASDHALRDALDVRAILRWIEEQCVAAGLPDPRGAHFNHSSYRSVGPVSPTAMTETAAAVAATLS